MWFVVKPRGRGGIVFLRSLIINNNVKQLYAKEIAYRTTIYAVEIGGKELTLYTPHEILLTTDNLKLGGGWEKIDVDYRTLRHKRYSYLRVIPFLRVNNVEHPLHPIQPDNYEKVEESEE